MSQGNFEREKMPVLAGRLVHGFPWISEKVRVEFEVLPISGSVVIQRSQMNVSFGETV